MTLRPWSEADAHDLVYCIDGDESIALWLDQIPQPYTFADALSFIGSTGETAFAVVDAAAGSLLGGIGVRWNDEADVAEIGYWLRREARGRGITSRALALAARHALDRGAARVQLRADIENLASRRVAEKVGFRAEGVLRSAHWNARLGRRQDWVMYSLLPGEL
ncbi:MAG: GNAT family N-acetyltransferase [Actinobacteria bacterium]|nr:GNAT family N-acetyltransferase [Actinomycetota bacterium]